MNENIDLTQILKDCPRGSEFYSSIYGKVTFLSIDRRNFMYPILVKASFEANQFKQFTKQGTYYPNVGECTLFPSKDQRDWNKFSAPWYKKPKFDPKTLKTFDKILVRNENDYKWRATLFSHINNAIIYPYVCTHSYYKFCIPYNDETKHLVGTKDEAPEYYRYWED